MGDVYASSKKTNILIRVSSAFLLISLFTLLFKPAPLVYAAGGDGTGGGGGDSPVSLSGAYVAVVSGNTSSNGASIDGASKLPLQPTIKLTFSVNVVDNTIWPSPNQSCITLRDGSGNSVPVNVFRIDPATNFEERNNIFLSPASRLAPGAQFQITISSSLQGKNGNTIGQSVSISFGTEGTPGSPSGQTNTQNNGGSGQQNASNQTGQEDSTAYEMKTNKASVATQTTKNAKGDEANASGDSSAVWWAVAFIVAAGLIIAAGEGFLRRKKNSGKKQNDLKNDEDSPEGGDQTKQ